MPRTTTIYQIIHSLDGAIFNLEQHVKLLEESYYQLFNKPLQLSLNDTENQIKAVITSNRCPKGISLFVEIQLDESGIITIGEIERSIYRGYTLRCISPTAVPSELYIPQIAISTTIRKDLFEWANTEAVRHNSHLLLSCHSGQAEMINGSQIFGVNEVGVVTAAKSFSVEHALAKRRLSEMNIKVIERPIFVEELLQLEELFIVDHYGVTAIKSCCGRGYMSITADALATALNSSTR